MINDTIFVLYPIFKSCFSLERKPNSKLYDDEFNREMAEPEKEKQSDFHLDSKQEHDEDEEEYMNTGRWRVDRDESSEV